MAIHQFIYNGEEYPEAKRVGNSMSTYMTIVEGRLTCYWKNNVVNAINIKPGDRVRIPAGGPAAVMTPPSNPVARVAWEKNFFKGKRVETLEELRKIVEETTRYSVPHGCEIRAAKLYLSYNENCAISYKAAMDGWVGVPYHWWANEKCTPDEIASLVGFALGESALHIYT
jgi:hypothetical protein